MAQSLRVVEAALLHFVPTGLDHELGVDLLLPQDTNLRALGVVVETREADERGVGGVGRRNDFLDEVLPRANADNLASLDFHRGGGA